jgi:hypothetical protein
VPIFQSMTLAKFLGAVLAFPTVVDRVRRAQPTDVAEITVTAAVVEPEEGAWVATANGQPMETGTNGGRPQHEDWRRHLVPAGDEPIAWVDDAIGLWPVQELSAGLTSYSGPGDIGDLSALSELELAEVPADDQS